MRLYGMLPRTSATGGGDDANGVELGASPRPAPVAECSLNVKNARTHEIASRKFVPLQEDETARLNNGLGQAVVRSAGQPERSVSCVKRQAAQFAAGFASGAAVILLLVLLSSSADTSAPVQGAAQQQPDREALGPTASRVPASSPPPLLSPLPVASLPSTTPPPNTTPPPPPPSPSPLPPPPYAGPRATYPFIRARTMAACGIADPSLPVSKTPSLVLLKTHKTGAPQSPPSSTGSPIGAG